MSGTTVASGENVGETYLRRLLDVLGAKGIVVLAAFPAVFAVSSAFVDPVSRAVAGFLFAAAFSYALVLDKERSPTDEIDPVAVSLVLVSAGYAVLAALGAGVTAASALAGAVLVFGAVVYGYLFKEGVPDNISTESLQEIDADPLHIDVVGFALVELTVIYSVLLATGWAEFANSPAFGVLAFLVYAGTVSTFAGYAVVTREVVVSRTDDEVHELLVGVLGDISAIDDDVLRNDISSRMRLVADCLDGVKLPTEVEDEHGEVPVVLSTRRPDARRLDVSADEVLDAADEKGFTGYAVHGETVLLFRNGTMTKYYRDGEYGYNPGELDASVADATFHTLDHQLLNELDDVTPKDEDVVDPDEVEAEEGDEETEAEDAESKTLNVGGEEIDMEEMFEKADEVMEDLSE